MVVDDTPVIIGTLGRYLEMRRAVLPLVESTRMALAFCSDAAPTAAMDTVSAVGVGRGWRSRSSSYKGGWQMACSASRHVSAIMRTAHRNIVIMGAFSFEATKHTRLNGVGAFCGLPRQHHTVGAIQHCICDVADFRTSGPRVVLWIFYQ